MLYIFFYKLVKKNLRAYTIFVFFFTFAVLLDDKFKRKGLHRFWQKKKIEKKNKQNYFPLGKGNLKKEKH